jgi:DNA polymerase III subunit beta
MTQLIKANREAVLKPLSVVSGIVERRHTLPILANVLIQKNGEDVTFTGTDIEIQIQTQAALGNGKDLAATTVSARKLLDILKSLPDNVETSLSLSAKRLTVQSGKSRFSLQTLDAEDFPAFDLANQFKASLSLPQKTLKHLIHMVHFAMAKQDIRYFLNGLLFVVEGDQVRAVATDGHRLAYCSVAMAQGSPAVTEKQEVIIPSKTILELQRLLGETDDPVKIDVAASQIRFSFGEVVLVSKLVEGKFPDYRRVIPQDNNKKITLNRDALSRTMQRVAILTSEKLKGVRMNLTNEGLKLQASNAEQEEAIEELDVDYQGDKLEVSFNITYLQEVLANLKQDNVGLEFKDSNSSALLTVPGDDSFKYVVMPLRI